MEVPRFFKAWGIFFIAATLGGGVAGFIAGAVVGATMGGAGLPMESIELVAKVLGFLVALPVSFLAYQWSVTKFILDAQTPPRPQGSIRPGAPEQFRSPYGAEPEAPER